MQYVFRDTEFMSAHEKALALTAWVRFLKNGLRFADFTDRLYKHLINHCSFIAHYNRDGFYAEYFENGEDSVRFLSQFDKRGECRSVEYGNTWWMQGEYEDLNQTMVDEGVRYIPTLMEKPEARQRSADIGRAEELLRKHGLELT